MADPASPLGNPMTVGEFFEFDDGTDMRYELVEGRPIAMDPAAVPHVVIASNVYDALLPQLKRPCRVYFAGGVARHASDDEYRIPDIFVSYAPLSERYFDHPRLLVEILSPSTAKDDRTRKLDFYKSFDSAEAILFIWQDKRRVELHTREPDGWKSA